MTAAVELFTVRQHAAIDNCADMMLITYLLENGGSHEVDPNLVYLPPIDERCGHFCRMPLDFCKERFQFLCDRGFFAPIDSADVYNPHNEPLYYFRCVVASDCELLKERA